MARGRKLVRNLRIRVANARASQHPRDSYAPLPSLSSQPNVSASAPATPPDSAPISPTQTHEFIGLRISSQSPTPKMKKSEMNGKELRDSLDLQMQEEIDFLEQMKEAERPEPKETVFLNLMKKHTVTDWRLGIVTQQMKKSETRQ
ncbi:hypothetical protein SERLA73DRAFT_80324 [Serpula lacrymans var. lacrymans S7.3]|uniref:Uncharacterized protein n=1 Tax=Serpula lacrymans var. lacrymans (strain S7.3) TaxID=936435 RepID=F8QJE5_SERL3|nr:hypothetical protein SERLA73DRAFT_80324 [Serpula lacrymans var. lacrymans S7.3]